MVFEYILYFFIYSCAGWCVEVIHATLKRGRFENRGFLNGCLCPIYGIGAVLILLCLTPLNIGVYVLFPASVALASLLEFVVGFVLEKLFKTKWWDYSGEHFNIKGYVCLKYSLLWGIACVLLVDVVHPPLAKLIAKMPNLAVWISCGALVAGIAVDIVFTVIQLAAHQKNYAAVEKICSALKIPSDAVGERISQATTDAEKKLAELKQKIRSSRLFKAFPEQKRRKKNACENMEIDLTEKEE
ncbi:MAG: putative ABC transporter permease [Clostridia bacterium]|uniref:putative ABC transporter permease n=1 Tax=Pumilibacter muris TaxID=2941510 RepID=UPI0020404DC6|nr:putative ABC transporter permease [Pumilibacter muris]MCI8595944.1 putative ABC transporter permease [Clostridia bacterium]